jgi:hypothetical protein
MVEKLLLQQLRVASDVNISISYINILETLNQLYIISLISGHTEFKSIKNFFKLFATLEQIKETRE